MFKKIKFTSLLLLFATFALTFAACGDDDDEPEYKDYDGTLYGEWIEVGPRWYCDYYYFGSDGQGTHGQWDVDCEWVNDEEDITWYTVDDEYIYIDGRKMSYYCDGTILEMNGKTYYAQ